MIAAATKRSGLYRLPYSQDPALALPADEAEASLAYRVASETGAWDAVTKQGEKLTLFVLRPLDSVTLLAWQSLVHGKVMPAGISEDEWSLLFRAALVDVENMGDARVRRNRDATVGTAADPEILDWIPRLHLIPLLREIGTLIFCRERDIGPKS